MAQFSVKIICLNGSVLGEKQHPEDLLDTGKETTSYQSHGQRHGSDDPLTTTTNLTGRDLLTPDEIMQMPAHLQLLRIQGQPVTLARKLRYYADPEFKDRFDRDRS